MSIQSRGYRYDRWVINGHQSSSIQQLGAIFAGLVLILTAISCRPQVGNVPGILYLGWDSSDRVQIFRQSDPELSEQMTSLDRNSSGNVTTFSISPDGAHIVYSLMDNSAGSEIRMITVGSGKDESLLLCPTAECGEFSWSPDNMRLVFERRELDGATAGQPQLWWLDTITGEAIPLIDDESGPVYGASFSPDGQWLAYVSAREQGVVVVNLLDGDQRLIPSETGMPSSWRPDSQAIVISRNELASTQSGAVDDHDDLGTGTAVHLYLHELSETADPIPLSGDLFVDDSAPQWSPDGQWLTIGRRLPSTAGGRQIWRMRPDGSEASALTADESQHYGPASWSSDGRYLLYQRYPAFERNARASIWLMDMETGEERQIAQAGFLPRWLIRSD